MILLMFKIIIYSIIFVFLFCFNSIFSQNIPEDSTSHALTEIHNIKLHLNPLLNSKKIFLGQDDFNIIDQQISLLTVEYDNNNDSRDINRLKFEIKEYVTNRLLLLPNYDLGEFGKYLGYAQTIAVVLMAIAHISKYGFK